MKQFKKRQAYEIVANNLKEKGIIPFSARQYTIDNVIGIVNKFEHKHKEYFSMHETEVITEWVAVKRKLIEENEESRKKVAFG
jgi:L-rhamnose mutarotase